VMPVMVFGPATLASASREMLRRGVAVVVVGFPATPLLLSRVRFCISAGHTRAKLDEALAIIDEVSKVVPMRFKASPFGLAP
jgi:serine palmitoyltransferase